MFVIGEAVVEEEIAREGFACDTLKCKGACCTLDGGRGAPLEDSEVPELVESSKAALHYLPEERRRIIAEHGMYEGPVGQRATVCIENRDCVFVFYEEGVARCSLEKAYLNGETRWRKPLSCHLFPIRVSQGQRTQLRYERISECRSAVERGTREQIPLYRFLESPLTRRFGQAWYEQFRSECERRTGANG